MKGKPLPYNCAVCGFPLNKHRITGKGTPFYNEECPPSVCQGCRQEGVTLFSCAGRLLCEHCRDEEAASSEKPEGTDA